MSFLFGGKTPKPQRMPASPSSVDNAEAQAARDAAARSAMADSMLGGRRSTIVAGMKIAADEQQARRRNRPAEVLGE